MSATCNHALSSMIYKVRDHQNWNDVSRAAYSCQKCLPKVERWVSAQTGHFVTEAMKQVTS